MHGKIRPPDEVKFFWKSNAEVKFINGPEGGGDRRFFHAGLGSEAIPLFVLLDTHRETIEGTKFRIKTEWRVGVIDGAAEHDRTELSA